MRYEKRNKEIFLRCKVNQLFVQKWLRMKKHGTKKKFIQSASSEIRTRDPQLVSLVP